MVCVPARLACSYTNRQQVWSTPKPGASSACAVEYSWCMLSSDRMLDCSGVPCPLLAMQRARKTQLPLAITLGFSGALYTTCLWASSLASVGLSVCWGRCWGLGSVLAARSFTNVRATLGPGCVRKTTVLEGCLPCDFCMRGVCCLLARALCQDVLGYHCSLGRQSHMC